MKMKMLSIILAVVLLTALTACSENTGGHISDSDSPSGAESVESAESAPESDTSSDGAWNPFVMQRQVLVDEGSRCGVVYLGYGSFDTYGHNFTDDRAYFADIIKNGGYAESFDFLLSVPDDHWVDTVGGTDFYLIIPTDEKARVEVNYLILNEETFDMDTGERLYAQENGAPFLLKCNYSDLIPECEVVITDSDGEELRWRPQISLRDGTVVTTAQDGKLVHDFTVYPEGTKEE